MNGSPSNGNAEKNWSSMVIDPNVGEDFNRK
jgi:hypothetical protein